MPEISCDGGMRHRRRQKCQKKNIWQLSHGIPGSGVTAKATRFRPHMQHTATPQHTHTTPRTHLISGFTNSKFDYKSIVTYLFCRKFIIKNCNAPHGRVCNPATTCTPNHRTCRKSIFGGSNGKKCELCATAEIWTSPVPLRASVRSSATLNVFYTIVYIFCVFRYIMRTVGILYAGGGRKVEGALDRRIWIGFSHVLCVDGKISRSSKCERE